MALPAFIAAAALTTLTACAGPHSKERPQLSESFDTHITSEGTKLFTYELSMQRPKERQRQGPPPGGDKGDSSKADKMKKKLNQHLVKRLESKLEETGYCREGYFTLEKNLNRGKASVKGECREAATREDVERFL